MAKRWEYEKKLNETIRELREKLYNQETIENAYIRRKLEFEEKQEAALIEAAIEGLYWRIDNFRSLDAVKKAFADPGPIKSNIKDLVKKFSPFLVMKEFEAVEFVKTELKNKWLENHAEDDE
ncbi:hypothetical protein [Faecalibaculum rodentium]|uniref:hypothetical protein n=1 Tax=Faecalibaculum rodentium TaxID=1702221 RepID=UPI0023F1BEA5|nr:hypothetical protein [Faecalibaculum rodentium]